MKENKYRTLEKPEISLSLLRTLFEKVGESYPNFDSWLEQKVLPDLKSGNRDLIVSSIKGEIAGFILTKDSEKKVCTIFVKSEHRNKGIADKLLIMAKEKLGTNYPKLTVGKKNYPIFKKLFDKHNFKITKEIKGYYKPEETEIFFN